VRLARDVLDKEIVDVHGFKAGKVDNILLELAGGEKPVVRGIITQHGSLALTWGRTIGRIAAWARQQVLGLGSEVVPLEVGWERVTYIDVVVHLDLDRRDAGLMRSEDAVWERWISHLPFARR
jgi:sporulation protein YlmC with PRC-barrel domain